MALVSVIIPTYNRRSLVVEAVDCVLRQTIKDIEVIVVDDGSTDDTCAVIKAIDDPRIRYFYKENGGVSTARNLGMEHATGNYLCFLDSDDLWPINFVEVMLEALYKNPDYGAAFCAREILYPDGRRVQSGRTKYSKSGRITADLFAKMFIQTSTLCFRRAILDGFCFDETLWSAQDVDAWLRLSTKTQYLFIPTVQIVYRAEHGVSPRIHKSWENGNKILILERFYFRLGGDRFITRNSAMREISSVYKTVAKTHYRKKARRAAVYLYKRAITYWPFRLGLYVGLLCSLLLSKKSDCLPDWQMPKPLPDI